MRRPAHATCTPPLRGHIDPLCPLPYTRLVDPDRPLNTAETSDLSRGAPKIAAIVALCAVALIPWLLPPRSAATPPETRAFTPSLIDLNTATAAELELLPGIGPTRAAEIIRDRTLRGPFRSIQSLDRIKGIGAITIRKVAEHATVQRPTPAPPSTDTQP